MFPLNQTLLDDARAVFAGYPHLYWILGGACAGKSTIAQAVAARLGWDALDMDSMIYGTFMAHYTDARHPASRAWFGAANPLAWVMALSWEEFNALTTAADAEYLDLFARELAQRDPAKPLLMDGGLAHPAVLARVMPPARIVCIAVDDAVRVRCWEHAPARAEMRAWLAALPNPAAMWAKFLRHDRLMTQTMDAECTAVDITRVERGQDEAVDTTAARVVAALDL